MAIPTDFSYADKHSVMLLDWKLMTLKILRESHNFRQYFERQKDYAKQEGRDYFQVFV